MTDIEALLSVDAGRTPPGTLAFFLDDGSRGFRHAHAALAVVAGLAATAGLLAGWGRAPVTLLVLLGALLVLWALPTLPVDENRDPKRQVLVVMPAGLIVRDASGLRRWRFEDLSDVAAGIHDSRPYLKLIDRDGKRHTVECAAYRRSERVRRIVLARLQVTRSS